jgi:LysM repeat protein
MHDEVEETVVVEEPVVVEHVHVHDEPSPVGEMLRFFALVVVLGVVVLVVAAARPLIFGTIVPAVMGENIVVPTAESPRPAEETNSADTETDDNEADEADAEDGDSSTDTGVPDEAGATDDISPTATPSKEDESGETAEESPPPATDSEEPTLINPDEPQQVTHTVVAGETLRSIASQYGVTVPALIAANSLTNPDYIRVGDKLVIPPTP